jgi:hypothetical protein
MTALWPGMQQTPHLHGHLMPLLCPCQAARHSCLIERRRKSPDDSIVIDLKEHFVATIENVSGYPLAFPRPGVKKILENERVIVWDCTWTLGVASPTPKCRATG